MFAIAQRVLRENRFEPEMPEGIERDVPAHDPSEGILDMRSLPWSSIDNDDSRDLDQIEVADQLAGGQIRVRIGIADVDALAPKGSRIDQYAQQNTSTLYTGVHIFPMLPELLSVHRTSLLPDGERLAVA